MVRSAHVIVRRYIKTSVGGQFNNFNLITHDTLNVLNFIILDTWVNCTLFSAVSFPLDVTRHCVFRLSRKVAEKCRFGVLLHIC